MFNQYLGYGIKEFCYKILGNKYINHENVIEKIANSVSTKKDYEEIANTLIAFYEAGFMRAVEQQKDVFAKHGLQVTIVGEAQKVGPTIFSQKNQDDNQK